jgi:hypothetical protein
MNKFDRIDGLIKVNDLAKFQEVVLDIADHLELEGFELQDVKEYLIRELNEMLGDL